MTLQGVRLLAVEYQFRLDGDVGCMQLVNGVGILAGMDNNYSFGAREIRSWIAIGVNS